MTHYEKDIAHKNAVRALYMKAAQGLIKDNVSETRNPHLSADQVSMLAEYQRKIAEIDREIKIKMPTELVLQRLAWEDEAFNERQRLLEKSVPTMKKITQQNRVAISKKFGKHIERYLNSVEEDDNVLLLADEVVSQPSSYEADRDDGIIEQIVTGALGRPSAALNNKLITAIKTCSTIRDFPIEDTQLLPAVPTHLP